MTLHISSVFTYDEDAGNYIQAVETADGQALESATRKAINNFVIGCKQDGIWDAIKASCILAGARTLAGALVPLAGSAPTKFGTEGNWNYNRKTGLQGDGSTNYLDSGRAGSSDPQSNNHHSLYGTSFPSTFEYHYGLLNTHFGWNAGSIFFRNNSTATAGGIAVSGANFIGMTRSASLVLTTRSAGVTGLFNVPSFEPDSRTSFIFGANLAGGLTGASDARIAFYSIGEALDLALLDGRVTDLITAFGAAIP